MIGAPAPDGRRRMQRVTNPILSTDSYKHSHFLQYPPETRTLSAYVEARPGGFSDQILFLGLQPFLIDFLGHTITRHDVEEAQALTRAHGLPFNRAGWDRVVSVHRGHLPLSISALPEGMIVPTGVPCFRWRTPTRNCPGWRPLWKPPCCAPSGTPPPSRRSVGIAARSSAPVC
jgi:nicotinic acid phosphoribosyltransferase